MTDIDKNSRTYKIAAGKGVMNLPNILTLSRIVMVPLFVLFFYLTFSGHQFVALAIFALASITDFFDGRIARKYRLVTNLGKFLDPIADKVLVASSFIVMLTVPTTFTCDGLVGDWIMIAAGCGVAVILSRELIISGFRTVAANRGIVIAADKIGKYKTATQDFSIVFLILAQGFLSFPSTAAAGEILYYIGIGLFALCVLLTIISGVHYLVKNSNVLKQ